MSLGALIAIIILILTILLLFLSKAVGIMPMDPPETILTVFVGFLALARLV